MNKKPITAIFFLLFSTSCVGWIKEESKISAKSAAASSRINNSSNNNQDLLKELDE